MKTCMALNRVRRYEKHVPRRLLFERLEFRHMLSTWGFVEPGAAADANPASNLSPAAVVFRLQATDTCGRPIDRVFVGDEFWLEAYVQDLRPGPQGVFAAYLDVEYDEALVTTGAGEDAGLIFGTSYENGKSGQFSPGAIDEAGAFAGFTQLYGGEHLVFAVPFTATVPGVADFAGNPAEALGHDILVYGSDSSVSWAEVRILDAQVTVEAGSAELAAGQAASGGISDSGWDFACRGAMIGGSGADLATSRPLEQPPAPHDWPSYSPPETSVQEGRGDGLADSGATPVVPESRPRDGWLDRSWLTASPDGVITISVDWLEADYAYDGWSLPWEGSSRTSALWYEPHVMISRLAVGDFGGPDSFNFTVSFAEPLLGGSGAAYQDTSVVGLQAAAEIVPPSWPAFEVSQAFEFRANDTGNGGSRWGEASIVVADDRWTPWEAPWQTSRDPIHAAPRKTLPLAGASFRARETGDGNPLRPLLTKPGEVQRDTLDQQLLDAVFEEQAEAGVPLADFPHAA